MPFSADTYADQAAMLTRMAALAAADGRHDLADEFTAAADRDVRAAQLLRIMDDAAATDDAVDAAGAELDRLERERDLADPGPDLSIW